MTYNPPEKWIATDPITVRLPNGEKLKNTHECYLPIPELPTESITARIFPGLHTASLLSIGQLCDVGCEATFVKNNLKITYQNKIIVTGDRNFHTGMWEVTLPQSPDTLTGNQKIPLLPPPNPPCAKQQPNIHSVFRLSTTSSAILYLHAAALFPVKTTWLRAIKNNFFSSWPFLTYAAVSKYLPLR